MTLGSELDGDPPISIGLTARFAGTESNKQTDDTGHQQEQSDEVELSRVLPPSPTLVWVEIQEQEQEQNRKAACRSTRGTIINCKNVRAFITTNKLMKKHLSFCQKVHIGAK